jgi:dihydroorotate dehydrogenase (fumarate)
MNPLSTRYAGLTLANPFMVGASPFCDNVSVARRLQDLGAAAVVMRSLFAEQIAPVPCAPAAGREARPTGDSFPEFADYQLSPEQYVRQLAHLKDALTIPVIASLNGHQPDHWLDFAPRLEQAGADAIELNFYQVVTDAALESDRVELDMIETVARLTESVRIPVAVKLSPFHASIAQLAVALELAGAQGVVIFNRFYQPDIDVHELEVRPQLRLSDSSELLLRLRWLAILAPQLRGSLAVTGGVHGAEDIVKALLAGAHAVQVVSALLRHGVQVLPTLLAGLQAWMRRHEFGALDEFRGRLDLRRCADPAAFERANYIRALQGWRV